MIGIVLVSHGKLAEGMNNALKMFFGDEIEALETVALTPEKSTDEFMEELKASIENVNHGQGVVVFADLFGGTPYNQAIQRASDTCCLVSGMNMGIVMELLGLRLSDTNVNSINFEQLINVGKDGIKYSKGIVICEEDDDL